MSKIYAFGIKEKARTVVNLTSLQSQFCFSLHNTVSSNNIFIVYFFHLIITLTRPEVQKLFEKYVNNDLHVRRLDHEMAMNLLQNEFSLNEKAAVSIVDYFDTDRNGSLSLWEFQHFYNLAGPRLAKQNVHFERSFCVSG